jgi:hypothetical protein
MQLAVYASADCYVCVCMRSHTACDVCRCVCACGLILLAMCVGILLCLCAHTARYASADYDASVLYESSVAS